jgi:hypothetical protein
LDAKSDEYNTEHKQIDKLQDDVKEFIKMIEVTQINITQLGKISAFVGQTPDLEAKLSKDVDAEVKKRKFDDAFYKKNDLYRAFVSSWWDVHHRNVSKPWEGDDDEVVDATQAQNVTIKCPITHAVMTHVVRNVPCGHRYDKKGADLLLGNVREVNCPIAGCSHKMSRNTLEDDYAYQVLVERKVKENSKQSMTQTTASIDLDDEELAL